jgi:hypothetical protein
MGRTTSWGSHVRGAIALPAVVAVLLLVGCAAEEPPPDDLPLPPEPPARIQSGRQAAAPARPRGGEPEAPAEAAAPDPAPVAASEAPPPTWRVARDGTLGCADPAPLRLLRQGADTPPRLLAEARAAGACRTTFRVNAWAQEAVEGDLVRLRLLNGDALTLWFLRMDVVAP